ncbi:UPF0149 family protein [Aestuariicoccus sp. MJ-SS9]|uniref:UPF0149 family protein n=1 Tax=Aestuariicoccus sp. MJ-SS9 TaxID=3079855 RepID=UPI0039772954
MCRLACLPDMIPPSERLPEVRGSCGMSEFGSEKALQNAIDLIMGHCNEVAQSLLPPKFEYGPVFAASSASRTQPRFWRTSEAGERCRSRAAQRFRWL